MENQHNNFQELEELRSQVAEFKNRIEQQEIVNLQLLKSVMKKHVTWIKRYNIWGDIVALILMPWIVSTFRGHGCPWTPIVIIVLMLIGELIFNIWNVSSIHNKHLLCDDVLSMQQRLIKFRRREKIQSIIEFPVLIGCLVWGLFASNSTQYFVVVLASVFLLGVLMYYHEMHSLNKAIKEIDEFAGKD